MNITTKFDVDDIVEFDGKELRVYEINIIMDDFNPKGDIEYVLIEPADCDDRSDYYKLDADYIGAATLVRPAAEELARLGWA